jgi:hypothetical protein
MYRTKHADPIQRILAAYGQGPGLISALETYVKTVEDNARRDGQVDVAKEVCIGLHNGPPKGVMCSSCHDAEVNAPMMMNVEAEIEMAKERK